MPDAFEIVSVSTFSLRLFSPCESLLCDVRVRFNSFWLSKLILMQNEVTVGRLPEKADIAIPVATGEFTPNICCYLFDLMISIQLLQI